MPSYLGKTEIPQNKTDCVHLLFLLDDNLALLSPKQIAAIRAIYHLDDNKTIEQIIREGSALTDGMEDETEVINQFQRGEP